MVRCFSRTPPPQEALQEVQRPQSFNLQSTGHGSMLQGSSTRSGGHVAPLLGVTSTLRFFRRTPPPH
eukprot:2030414-Amphidinium_carterae.1